MAEGWHDPFREEALAMAADALTTAMDFYFDDRRPVPAPSAQEVNRLTDLHNPTKSREHNVWPSVNGKQRLEEPAVKCLETGNPEH